MSGHSKWSTIKRQKGVNDAKKSQIFSKLARAITLAAKQGGVDPTGNIRLRLAIEQAHTSNMPKENVERALRSAQDKLAGGLEEVLYEGYGPGGVAVIVEVATDNRNRTAQEIKNIFERAGGSLAGPGSVSFQFSHKGLILVEKGSDSLSLIDLGVPDLEETDDGVEIYVAPSDLGTWKQKLEEAGFKINSAELIYKPENLLEVTIDKAKQVISFLETLDDNEDVQKVYTNLDIPAN